ncbi:hypothetical protein B0H17DRAFT_1214778 [Mycena rosella]|uniref:Transmembrane protein n=1 Tax=Mycena rosella TaxID=1033263 RepID=A0AAD7G0G7_MYCRO|nr:hypothetical protein B0H17DRAFT_1214778 [Mycena rosella]
MHLSTRSSLLFTAGSATLGHCQNAKTNGKGSRRGEAGGGAGADSFLLLCPSLNKDGTVAGNATLSSNGALTCNYPIESCVYLISSGLLSSGLSACPPALPNVTAARSELSLAFATTASSTQSSASNVGSSSSVPILGSSRTSLGTTSTGTGTSVTSAPLAGSAKPSKRLPTEALAVIIFSAAIIFMALTGTIICLRRRRLQRRATGRDADRIRGHGQRDTISPFTLIRQIDGPSDGTTTPTVNPDAHSVSASMIARLQSATELPGVEEKMVDLEDEVRRTSIRGSRARRLSRPPSLRATSPDVDAQLQAARDQISMLMMRMNAVEANTDPGWDMGISDRPPPQYV